MIPRGHDAIAPGDSCLHAMGGFSIEMEYWFYHEWPEELQLRTLKHIKNDKDGELVVINCMEYATFLVGYAAAYYYWVTCRNAGKLGIEYPCVLFLIDNTSAETWTRKGCKNSTTGRALGRLHCSLMMNSPVGIHSAYINTKANCIADDISRIKKEAYIISSILQLHKKYPSLGACKRFHPSPELLSYIQDALLSKQLADPLIVRRIVQKNPGKMSGCCIADLTKSPTNAC